MNSYLDEVLRLVSLGYHVFPCLPNRKLPFAAQAPKGCNSASNDAKIVRNWWRQHPDCNIGLKCENVLVVDVDCKNGKDGTKDISNIVRELGPLPRSPLAETPSGGFHLFFARPESDIVGKTHVPWKGKATGIDIRVGNQYIVAPPSFRDDVPVPGKEDEFTTGSYAWKRPLVPLDELPVLPDSWIENFLPHRQRKPAAPQSPPGPPGGRPILPSGSYNNIDRCRAYLERSIRVSPGKGATISFSRRPA